METTNPKHFKKPKVHQEYLTNVHYSKYKNNRPFSKHKIRLIVSNLEKQKQTKKHQPSNGW